MNPITDTDLAAMRPAPKGTGASITVRLTPDQIGWLGAQAEATGRTLSDVIRDLITAARADDTDVIHLPRAELHRLVDQLPTNRAA